MGWFSNVVHGVLDVAGMIPGVGAVADGLNAVVYLAEGDYANAAMSAVAMVPGIGDSIALASKGAKVMKGMKALSKLDKAKVLLKGAKKAGAKALGSVKGMMKEGGKLLKDFDYKFAWKSIKDKTKCFFGKGKCFTGDTLVKAEHGYVPICEIQAGDLVWSMDEESGESALKRVKEVFCTQAHTIYEIEIEGKEVVKSTAYHPFYVAERGWVDAIQLEEKDLLVTEEGAAEITKIGKYRQEEPVETYNFHVEDWCSYFVSERCVYVHNMADGEHGSIKEIIKEAMGNGKGNKFKWGNSKSKPTYGHTFTEHGAKKTPQQLTDRARDLEHQVGKWENDQKAADFLADVAKRGEGTYDVQLPSDVSGRSFLPDGTEIKPDMGKVVVKPEGSIRTAYPYSGAYPTSKPK